MVMVVVRRLEGRFFRAPRSLGVETDERPVVEGVERLVFGEGRHVVLWFLEPL